MLRQAQDERDSFTVGRDDELGKNRLRAQVLRRIASAGKRAFRKLAGLPQHRRNWKESYMSTHCVLAGVFESGGYAVDAELDVVGKRRLFLRCEVALVEPPE